LRGAGKYENRKFHDRLPARYVLCAGWLEGIFLYAGWFSVRLSGEIGKIPQKINNFSKRGELDDGGDSG
jgi:hypothetical protein